MVTKTITIPDEHYDRIRKIELEEKTSFSAALVKLLQLGYAYKTLLEIEASERSAKKAAQNKADVI